jgi:hypothetical protein
VLPPDLDETTLQSAPPESAENAPLPRTSRYTGEAQEVGAGGNGTVLSARDAILRRKVAIKRVRSGDEGEVLREARIAAQLDHPAIVTVFDVFRDQTGALCVAMRLVEGASLGDRLRGAHSLDDRLKFMPAMLQVAQAVAYAHRRGVVHLDLKPQNVMLGDDGQVSVIDWGLARALERSERAVDVSNALQLGSGGTPAYWSPEQASGEKTDERSDVWGLGAILFQILTGQPPWHADSLPEAIERARTSAPPSILEREGRAPPELTAICEKALERTPGDRYPTAVELAADLEAWLQGRAISARRRTFREALVAFVRRNPWPVGAAAFALVCLALSAAIITSRVREERDEARKLSRVFGRAASRGIEPRPEHEPLLEQYTRATEAYFARLGADVTDADRVDLALAWDRLARIHQRLGKYALARTEAQRSKDIATPLVNAHPDDAAAQEALIGALLTQAGLAQLDGTPSEEFALRTQTLAVIDAAPMRESLDSAWLELRTLALVQWLYGASEVDTARLDEAARLASHAAQLNQRTALMLDTFLLEERWKRGQLALVPEHLARIDAEVTGLLQTEPSDEARGLALYSLTVSGMIAAWQGRADEARAFWARVDRAAAQVDLTKPAKASLAGERARAWLAAGRLTDAQGELRRLVALGLPLGPAERLATLLLGESIAPQPEKAEDALDAFVLGVAAAKAGHGDRAAALVREAAAQGLSRQLALVPGMAARATAALGEPGERFSSAWDGAVTRGDAAAADAALEAFAAELAPR